MAGREAIEERTAEMEVERLRSVLRDIAAHAGAMAVCALAARPSTNAAGFTYLSGLAEDAVER